MFRKDKWFKLGWIYFALMFVLEAVLPKWAGNENGIIENLQMLWLLGGMYYCWQLRRERFLNFMGGEKSTSLAYAGMLYFFLLAMREISWGRALITMPDGGTIQYSQMGLYGKLVHPLVGILLVLLLWLIYRARLWRVLSIVKLPVKSFVLLLLFVFMSWVGERTNFVGFHGQVAEELAEFGAYMMMFCLVRDLGERLRVPKKFSQNVDE